MAGVHGRHCLAELVPLGVGPQQRLEQAGMGQAAIVVDVGYHQLMLQVVFAPAQRVDPASYRGTPLANVQVKPCNKSCIDLPATGHPWDPSRLTCCPSVVRGPRSFFF